MTWFRLLYLDIPLEKGFVYFLGLLDRLKGPEAEEALERLAVPMRIRERVRQARSAVMTCFPSCRVNRCSRRAAYTRCCILLKWNRSC